MVSTVQIWQDDLTGMQGVRGENSALGHFLREEETERLTAIDGMGEEKSFLPPRAGV